MSRTKSIESGIVGPYSWATLLFFVVVLGTSLACDTVHVDGATCGPGTEESNEGVCIVDYNACGPGTALIDGQCTIQSVDPATCSAGTVFEEGQCVPAPDEICGDGTLWFEGSCVATVSCGLGTELLNGDCVSNAYASLDVYTFIERLSREQCKRYMECGCASPYQGIGYFLFFHDEVTCRQSLANIYENALRLSDARILLDASRPVEQELELMQQFMDFYTTDDCTLSLDNQPQIFGSNGNGVVQFFQGHRSIGEPCLVDFACDSGLICLQQEASGQFSRHECDLPREDGQICHEDEDCKEGLYCSYGPEDNVCAQRLDEGELCVLNKECADGTSCFAVPGDVETTFICLPTGTVDSGAFCDDNEDCGPESFCSETGCQPARELGEVCIEHEECGSFARCVQGEGADKSCANVFSFCEGVL